MRLLQIIVNGVLESVTITTNPAPTQQHQRLFSFVMCMDLIFTGKSRGG